MKRSIYAILTVATVLVVAETQGATVAYWNFEDGVAGQPFDPDGGGNSGSYDTVNHVLMRGYDSKYGSSFASDNLYYNGLCMRSADKHQDGFVVESALQSWSPTNWTIECTARLDDIAGWNTLIGRDGSRFYVPESDFYLQNTTGGCFRLNYKTAGGQRVIVDATNVVVKAGQWYGLAVVSDGTKTSLYIDAHDNKGYKLAGFAALTGTNAAENALVGSQFTWTFGRGWYNGNFVDHINGAMDNIRFSDTALAPDELIPVPVDPLVITYAPTDPISGMSQTIEATIVDADSEFASAILSLDGTPMATNNTPAGTTNSVSYATERLYAGTHSAAVVVSAINPAVTITQGWTFVVNEGPVESMLEGAVPGKWTMDLETARQVAAEKKLPILIDFSGSDWCGWCKIMEKNVFTLPEWKDYAAEHVLMVLIDFPRDKSLVPEKYVDRNEELKKQYNVRGYPTYVILDDDGETELGRLRAGRDKTPESFRAELENLLTSRASTIEAYTATLSEEDKTAYLALLNQREENKLAQQKAQDELQALMLKAQINNMQADLTKQWLEDDLHFFRIARGLDSDERQDFDATHAILKDARKNMIDWMGSITVDDNEGASLYEAMDNQIKELTEQLSQYEK